MKHPWTINTKPVPGPTKVRMMLDDFSPRVACIFPRIGHLKRIGLVPQFQVVNPTVLFDFNLHGTHIPSPIFKDTDQVCSALKAKHESFAMSMYIDSWIQIVRVQDSWRLHLLSSLTRTQFETSLQSSTCWSTILDTRNWNKEFQSSLPHQNPNLTNCTKVTKVLHAANSKFMISYGFTFCVVFNCQEVKNFRPNLKSKKSSSNAKI